ncbi:hypothetical protein DFH07DRAFT_8250 [Mycena maculata]|uniref:Uncharacterized protein n=1 Tax=Mycena maculata TaxID=230809 RepID=A0AAD7P2W3_9AGAR|nr:hypothetical protein DFH07DRAFT_8250 [Mycena maculata]
MPPGQVSRGQQGTGLRRPVRSWLRTRSFSDISDDSDSTSSNGDSSSGSGSNPSNSGKSSMNDVSNNIPSSSSGGSGSDSSSGGSSSGSSATSSDGENSSSSSSAVPKPSGIPTLPPPPSPPCVLHCVPDNDPRVFYSPNWSISSQGFFQTSHQTDSVGSWLSFNFSGSAITVFGSIPASNATAEPPTAAYSIDAAKPFVTAQPLATQPIANQPLFSASQLSSEAHSLVINVTDVQSGSPFSVDYFIVTPSAPSASALSSASSLTATSLSSKTQSPGTTVGIVAGVLGSAIFILLGFLAFLFVILRRRRKRAQRSENLQSSLFTTTESILGWSRAPSSHFSTASPNKTPSRTVCEK